jgi:hypothetical protein
MALKYNKTTLKKLEDVLTSSEFTVRYERGQFKSGYCLLRDKKIVIINKFYDTKGRIEAMIDLIQQVELKEEALKEESKQILKLIAKSYAEGLS